MGASQFSLNETVYITYTCEIVPYKIYMASVMKSEMLTVGPTSSSFHYFNKGVVKSNKLLETHLDGTISFESSPLELGA